MGTTREVLGIDGRQRAAFERDGFILVRGVLGHDEVEHYRDALDRVYRREAAAGRLGPDRAMHKLSAVTHCPEAVGLIDHPRTFPLVWSILGWNIHVYHSHLDVHPPISRPLPPRFEWHQDGGRQNRELAVEPRPRLSVKVAYWLSDVSEPGRGNMRVVPGSHRTPRIDGPPRRDMSWPDPDGAIDVCAEAGDVVLFDRRLWHARSNNCSEQPRKVIFFGYTLRWVTVRDDVADLPKRPWWAELRPVQQQLLGGVGDGGDHAWGHYPAEVPLYNWLAERGLFDHANPPLKP
ncbi:MAG: phytanoyl-CoA dioxygenase family protein [Acidimicrobiales bacterium]